MILKMFTYKCLVYGYSLLLLSDVFNAAFLIESCGISRLQSDGSSQNSYGKPELIALEPIMDEGDNGSSHRQ